jgi:hypothetical protein
MRFSATLAWSVPGTPLGSPAATPRRIRCVAQLFEDFEGRLWHAYKDLMQKAAKRMEPEIGFLFGRDTQFEAGLVA